MFELAADKLAEDIKAVSYDFENFCNFGDEVLELPFLFEENLVASLPHCVHRRNEEFEERKPPAADSATKAGQKKGLKTGWFRCYGREAFKVKYDDAISFGIRGGPSIYYIYGVATMCEARDRRGGLEARNYFIYSSSGNHKLSWDEGDGSDVLRRSSFGGLPEVQLIS